MHRVKLFLEAVGGVLRRLNPSIPELEQIVVPEAVLLHLLHLSHHSKMADHPKRTCVFAHFRRRYYWSFMEAYLTSTTRCCRHCAINRLSIIHQKLPMR